MSIGESNLEVIDIFNLLESNQLSLVEDIKNLIAENFNSTREPWLVNGLYEYYVNSGSVRCMQILCGISKEVHQDFLIKRVNEGIRSPSARKQSLIFFGHLVRKQPTWLYKITQLGLFKELIRILKSETEVVNIVTGLLILTTLLPIIPSYIVSNVNEIFESFGRLASWISQNPNIPHEHVLHLQVALYSLFHRLYAMYPCNFLNYLRNTFGPNERSYIFKNTLKPMLETVKVHPYLIISSKDGELNINRWKSKEYHDIIAECSKLSLDLFETGYPEEVKNIRHSIGSLDMSLLPSQPSSLPYSYTAEKEMAGFLKDTMNINVHDLNSLSNYIDDGTGTAPNTPHPFTPQLSYNYSTMSPLPPVSSTNIIPGVPEIQPTTTVLSQQRIPSGKLEECTEATPECTPTTTPLKEQRYKKIGGNSPAVKSLAFKALPTTPPCTPTTSIPSSPLPKDPHGGVGDGTPQRRDSIYESNHQQMFRRDSLIYQRLQKVVQEQKDAENSGNSTATATAVVTGRKIPCPITIPSSSEQANNIGTSENSTGGNNSCTTTNTSDSGPPPLTPLFPTLPHIFPDNADPVDLDEFNNGANLTGLHLPDQKEMQAFAKRVSRLRFYSQCTTGSSPGTSPSSSSSVIQCGSVQNSQTTLTSPSAIVGAINKIKVKRSVSCPDIKKPISEDEEETYSEADDESTSMKSKGDERRKDSILLPLPTCPELSEETSLNSSTMTEKDDPKRDCAELAEPPIQPYEHLFEEILMRGGCDQDQINSPHILLERCLENAAEQHKGYCGVKEKRSRSIEDQINILKIQLEMLHCQLLFEKNRRETHTLRNRRLAGKCRKVQTLEEQNSTFQGLVHSLEKEVCNLKKEIILQRNLGLNKERELNELISGLERKVFILREDITCLKEEKADLDLRYVKALVELKTLQKEAEQKKADIFVLENDVKHCKKYVEYNRKIKQLYQTTQKEIVILGEIVRKQQEALNKFEPNRYIMKEMKDLKLTCHEEVQGLKNQLETKSSNLEAALGFIKDLENKLQNRDRIITDQKKLVQDTGAEGIARLKAVEDKYESVKAINHRLELEILNLQHQLTIKSLSNAGQTARSSGGGRRVNSSPSNGDFRSPSSPHLSNHSDVDSAASAGGLGGFSPDRSGIFIFGSPQFDSSEMNDLQRVIDNSNTGPSSSNVTNTSSRFNNNSTATGGTSANTTGRFVNDITDNK